MSKSHPTYSLVIAALRTTFPVMLGYISVGTAYGLLATTAGLSPFLTLLISLVVYAGSMQFVLIALISGGAGILQVIVMTLFVNIRHVFYGLSLIGPFSRMGRAKPYMIFSLTDETYSLLTGIEVPDGLKERHFYLAVSALNQGYWLIGSALGAFAASIVRFDTTGLDFAMTALFIIIMMEQWRAYKDHRPALIGLGASFVALLLFGPDQMVIPSMIFIVGILLFTRKTMEEVV